MKSEKELIQMAADYYREKYLQYIAYSMDCQSFLAILKDPATWRKVPGVETEEDRAKALEYFDNESSRADRELFYCNSLYNYFSEQINRFY